MSKLLIFDIDVFKYVINLPNIIEKKTFKRDLLISNSFTFTLKNINNLFSANNSKSIFSGKNWLYESIKYYNDDNILLWDGVIINLKINHRNKTTDIITKDKLFQVREQYIEYQSSDWETPVKALENIFTNYSFINYDNTTLRRSHSVLDTNLCYVKCNFNKSDNLTLFQAINKLSIVSGADAYSHFNNVYFQVWEKYTGTPNLKLNTNKDTRLKKVPIIEFDEQSIINDYDIDYDGSGTPLTDTANFGLNSRNKYGIHILEPMRTGTGKQIIFKDSTIAKFIGEKYIERTHYDVSGNSRALIKISFDLSIRFKNYIELGNYFNLTLSDEGWAEKIFEIYEFKKSVSKQNINIIAYEVTI